jgi:SAM-dependent methyltransferase
MDIASGPVEMVQHRLRQAGLSGDAFVGNILSTDLSPGSYDVIVSIGCLHHTGDLDAAIQNCYKLVRPSGRLIFMVYNAYSYRRFRFAPVQTVVYRVKELFGYRVVVGACDERQRAAYDAGVDGEGAPHTDWISVRSVRHLCRRFSTVSTELENAFQEFPFSLVTCEVLLKTLVPRVSDLDLYVTAVK